ncbi:hypothetical protein [Bacteroides reticulotermitis]|uniref:hypothetical protein n=1 Tax=Bacteroides reticulotermitis TaxID=1133319 RepID=UPI003A850EC0
MKTLLYILILASVCVSCRSSQPSTKTDTEVKGTEQKDEFKKSNDSLLLIMQQDIKRVYERVNSFTYDFTQSKTEYSAPDSTGKQHPTSTTETKGKVNSNTTEKSVTDEKVLLQFEQVRSSLDSLKSTVDYLIKQNTQTTPPLTRWQKLKQDFGMFTLGIFVTGILFIFVWLVYRIRKK